MTSWPLSHSKAGETKFFETLYDVPIMPGLQEIPEMSLSFDKPDGRISQAAAMSPVLEDKAILSFYRVSLPQMGWHIIAPASFTREGEKLEINIEKSGQMRLVRFSLSPQ